MGRRANNGSFVLFLLTRLAHCLSFCLPLKFLPWPVVRWKAVPLRGAAVASVTPEVSGLQSEACLPNLESHSYSNDNNASALSDMA